MKLDKRVMVRFPTPWVGLLRQHAEQVMTEISRSGRASRFAEWIRAAVLEKAQREGLALGQRGESDEHGRQPIS